MPKLRQARATAGALLLAAVAGLPLVSGCAVHAHPAPPPHRHAAPVAVAAVHVHSVRCGHYRHRSRWYHLRGHVHGRGCGHQLVGGIWILKR